MRCQTISAKYVGVICPAIVCKIVYGTVFVTRGALVHNKLVINLSIYDITSLLEHCKFQPNVDYPKSTDADLTSLYFDNMTAVCQLVISILYRYGQGVVSC